MEDRGRLIWKGFFRAPTQTFASLPGDDKAIGLNAVVGYQQFLAPSADGTVLLYNHKRMSMRQPEVNINAIGPLPGLDLGQMVCPGVEVYAPEENRVVREFSMISWKYTLFTECRLPEKTTLAESIIIFAQRLAWMSQKPLLIGGEMPIDHGTLQNIVKKICHDNQELFLADISPEMKEIGYLPSNIKSSLRSLRHVFMMNVFRCGTSFTKPHESVQTWNAGPPNADCFIASKALELTEAKLLDVEPVSARKVEMLNLENTYCQSKTETEVKQPTHRPSCTTTQQGYYPTSTTMTVPARPAKHSGG